MSIHDIIAVLDLAASERLPVGTRHGLCELKSMDGGTVPGFYRGGSWELVAKDTPVSYWRLRGKYTEERNEDTVACGLVLDTTIPLRLVAIVDRTVCENVQDFARAAATGMRGTSGQLVTTLGAMRVVVSTVGIEVDSSAVYRQEYGGAGFGDVNPNMAMVAIDLSVLVTGKETCLDVCGDPVDVVCKVIQSASNAKVEECLGATRLNEICDTDCDLCTLLNDADPSEGVACMEQNGQVPTYLCEIIDSPDATADLIVECIGNAGKTDAVEALICAPCLMTVRIYVNGVLNQTISDVNPCEDNTVNIHP